MTDLQQQNDELKMHKILQARAKTLTQEIAVESEKKETIKFTEFAIGNEHYGLENFYIKEVVSMRDFTPLPGVPAYVFGIINVHGRIIAVVDLRDFFEIPLKDISNYNKVIIISDEIMEFGVLANDIKGVRQVVLSELVPSLPTLTDIRIEYLKGITNERVIILDGGKLLNDKKIIVHKEV